MVTAEEMNDSTEMPENIPVVQEWNENECASSQQLSSIQMMCTRMNIDATKLVKEKLTKKEAVDILRDLNTYQTETVKIPEDLKQAKV